MNRDPELQQEVGRVVLFAFDVERRGEGKRLAAKYEVSEVPTFIVVRPDGREIGRWSGYDDPANWIERLNQIVSGGPGL